MPSQNQLLSSLSPALFDSLKSRLRTCRLDSGQVLFATGDKVNTVHFPWSGAVSLVTELSNGQMIECAIIGRDSVVGGDAAFDNSNAVCKAIVQVPGSGLVLDVETARRVLHDNEEFRTALMRHQRLILAQAQRSVACNIAHDISKRLARWLLRARDVTGSDTFQLTQEFMAQMLGVRRTSVSMEAHKLQQAGLISYKRGIVKIEKCEALLQSSCECYPVIKSLYDKLSPPKLRDADLVGRQMISSPPVTEIPI